MSIWTKFAIVFLCAAICALSVTLIPREPRTLQPREQTTPVNLRKADRAQWLLV